MFRRILNCDYEFVAPWWDDVSENAKVGAMANQVDKVVYKVVLGVF